MNLRAFWVSKTTSRRQQPIKIRLESLEGRWNPADLLAWRQLTTMPTVPEGSVAYIHPDNAQALEIQINDLRTQLAVVPSEEEFAAGASPVEVALPGPDGTVQRFAVIDAPVMAPELAAQFPEIRTYQGTSVDDPATRLRMDITPQGLHVQVLSPSGSWYIDPYFQNRDDVYVSYHRRDLSRDDIFPLTAGQSVNDPAIANRNSNQPTDPPGCTCALCAGFNTGADGMPSAARSAPFIGPIANRSGTQLRTYRLAVAATGEYTTFHGGTVSLGQAAIVTAVNRLNQVYESELSIRMVLVANNSTLVYTNSATDPYTNNDGVAMLDENQANITSLIGTANYDIGHVFSTGGGGIAALGSVGINSIKAEGVTGLGAPTGDPFYIDYVAHEIGHQFGANHSFNTSSDSNRNASTAFEPGSGSTIMGYAGITGSNSDLQNNSDPYFNFGSFNEIIAHVDGTIPNVGTRTATGNTVPTVNAGADYVIPARTPFVLTATGSDANGDTLTYSWEQRNTGAANLLNSADNGASPLFRVWNPTTDPSRTFPRLSNLVANTVPLGEKLPTTNWSAMRFRVTARDNRANGGGVNTDDMQIQVVDTTMAFTVSAPNTAVSWTGNTTQTISWNVAGTTASPINAANVNITLSTDGGFTYPHTLALNTPNDGTQVITVPNLSTSQARVRVQGANNIFFDISNVNFTISPGSNTAPTITSNGGGATASINAFEDNQSVTTVTANDPDVGNVLTYSLVGGVDQADFQINPTTGALTFVNPPSVISPADSDGNNVYLVTVQVSDGVAVDTQALTITVNAVNDAPTFTPGGDISVPFVAGVPPTYTFPGWATNINPGDAGETSQTLTFVVSTNNNALFQTSPTIAPNGTLSFTPATGASGLATVTVYLQDNGGTANGGVNRSPDVTFDLAIGNLAPVLDNSGSPELLPVGFNATTSAGTRISDFINGTITDVNASDPQGIVVTGFSIGGSGEWEYSTDDGVVWNSLETATPNASIPLRGQDRVRYIPANGVLNVSPTITYRAWDQSAGTPGVPINSNVNGTTTALSTATETASIRVAAVLTSVGEDVRTSGTVLSGLINRSESGFVDPNLLAKKGIAIIGIGGEIPGTFEASSNGRTWRLIDPVSPASALLIRSTDRIRFVPAANLSGDVYFKYRAWDQTQGTALGRFDLSTNAAFATASAFSSTTEYAVIRITPLNDRPELDTATTSFLTPVDNSDGNPAGDTVASLLGSTVIDYDAGTVPGIAVTGYSRSGGSWEFSTDAGVSWNKFTAVSTSKATVLNPTDLVRFLPTASIGFVGKPTLSYKAWDRSVPLTSGTTNVNTVSGTAFSSGVETAICVVDVSPTASTNNAPILTPASPTLTSVSEDSRTHKGDLISTITGGAITDSDPVSIKGIAITGLTGTANGTWQYSTNGVSWRSFSVVGPEYALLLKDSSRLRFLPNANWFGSATVQYLAWDQTRGTAGKYANLALAGVIGGASPFSNNSDTATVTVTPVNDAPVLNIIPAPLLTSVLPNTLQPTGDLVSSLLGTALSDVDPSSQAGIAIIKAASTKGTWEYQLNGTSGWIGVGTVSTSQARLLRSIDRIRFVPKNNFIGTDILQYRGWDQTSGIQPDVVSTTANTSLSRAIETATVYVNSVNDRPILDTKPDIRMKPQEVIFDDLNEAGTLASTLLNNIQDPDQLDPRGLAIVFEDTRNGEWQVSIDSGTFNPVYFSAVNNGYLVKPTDRIRFKPRNPGFVGSATIRFKAWDQTVGTAGSPMTTTGTAFSTAIETATLTINSSPELNPVPSI